MNPLQEPDLLLRLPPDYLVLPISIPPPPAFPTETFHYLYLRRDQPKHSLTPAADTRSLFLSNLPIDTTEAHLRVLFASLTDGAGGRLESVQFNGVVNTTNNPTSTSKRKRGGGAAEGGEGGEGAGGMLDYHRAGRQLLGSGSTGVAAFPDVKSRERTVEAVEKVVERVERLRRKGKTDVGLAKLPVWGEGLTEAHKVPPLGLERYSAIAEARYPDEERMDAEVEDQMREFIAQEEAERRSRNTQTVDEDGFVIVKKGPKAIKADKKALEEKQKKDGEALFGFYKFQAREQKKRKQEEMLKNFERDKKLIEERKKARGSLRPEE